MHMPPQPPRPPAPRPNHTPLILAILFGMVGLLVVMAISLALTVKPDQEEGAAGRSAPGLSQTKAVGVGQDVRLENGVRLQLKRLERGQVRAPAGGHGVKPGDPQVTAVFHVRNGSPRALDLTLTRMQARVGEDGRPAATVYSLDPADTVRGAIAPGQTATLRGVFSTADAADLRRVQVTVTLGLDYEPIVFEGGV